MKTLIGVVLDESGSMATKVNDVINGFNVFLTEQKKLTDPCRMMITKFNTTCNSVMTPGPIGDAKELTSATYIPGGNTALFDAVANTIKLIDAAKGADERVLVLIITDGEENSSRETTGAQITAIVKEREEKGDWTFTYLGPSPDKWDSIGLTSSAGNNAAYNPQAPAQSFVVASAAVAQYRMSSDLQSKTFYKDASNTPEQEDGWKASHK